MFSSPCCRSEGKRFGFAESLPTKKITVNRQDIQEIDTSDAMETAQEIVEQAEPPPKMYPIYILFHPMELRRVNLPFRPFCHYAW